MTISVANSASLLALSTRISTKESIGVRDVRGSLEDVSHFVGQSGNTPQRPKRLLTRKRRPLATANKNRRTLSSPRPAIC